MGFNFKVNTTITDRDKKLIVIFLIILILLGGFMVFLKPKYDEISAFKDKVNKNTEKRDDLEGKYIKLKDFKKELKLNKYKMKNLQKIIPDYLYTEDVMIAVNDLVKISKITSKTGNTVTDPVVYQSQGAVTVAPGFYKRDVSLNVEGSYKNIIEFLKLIKASRLNMIINNVSMTAADGGKMTGTIALSVYTYNPSGSLPQIINNGGILPEGDFTAEAINKGKVNGNPDKAYNNVIGYGANKGYSGDTKNKVDINKLAIDFYCILTSYKDDAPSVTVGKYPQGYTEVSSDGNENSDVTLNIQKSGGKYYYSYSIDGKSSYPETGEQEFKPTSKTLIFNVISSKRIDGADNTGIKLKINNNSDIKVLVKVLNDDKPRPRLKLAKGIGEYSLEN